MGIYSGEVDMENKKKVEVSNPFDAPEVKDVGKVNKGEAENVDNVKEIDVEKKLKNTKSALIKWSKEKFDNTFQEIATPEDIIKVREKQFEENPSGENRENLFKAHAEINMQLKREEDFWRQKSGFEWFKDGERNTKFFHTIEIISEIRKRGKPPNMLIKQDLMKAYDRVEWLFLTKVLRYLDFSEVIIYMVYRLLENNWYSTLLNCQPKGSFKSSRGLKQSDPLSPTLFIIAAEVLSMNLKVVMQKREFKLFGMPRESHKLNYLAFADDMIILCKAEVKTLQMVIEALDRYEEVSGQKINKEKSAIYLHKSVSNRVGVMAEVVTGILRKEFPFTYLGCPIFFT
ncbi:uncharacterized protein LOC124887771 [Capsicum annuum]|uniref:uncharacterized protein LOC124887771 n=1 Tax=Capsicum annuum TaxID=4072 RepID=UPI001FB0EAC3|nr:uncharacterized protein LOC124887771 [Capsicum annuum]